MYFIISVTIKKKEKKRIIFIDKLEERRLKDMSECV